jgi:hypothetical protein
VAQAHRDVEANAIGGVVLTDYWRADEGESRVSIV